MITNFIRLERSEESVFVGYDDLQDYSHTHTHTATKSTKMDLDETGKEFSVCEEEGRDSYQGTANQPTI